MHEALLFANVCTRTPAATTSKQTKNLNSDVDVLGLPGTRSSALLTLLILLLYALAKLSAYGCLVGALGDASTLNATADIPIVSVSLLGIWSATTLLLLLLTPNHTESGVYRWRTPHIRP